MPPKERFDFKIVICQDENGNTFDLATATPVFDGHIDFDPDGHPMDIKSNETETITLTINGKILRKAIKRAFGIRKAEILFPKKHRRNASLSRRRRRYHGRTKNVCQDDH